MKNSLFVLVISMLLISCSVEPQEVLFGEDACDFCKMTIVDSQHAAEIVTSKGKAFKFDAVECMMNYFNRNAIESETMAYILVMDYNHPGDLIDAKTASFIISENIPSPMGAFLSAVSNKEIAKQIIELKSGEIYDWTLLKNRYKVN